MNTIFTVADRFFENRAGLESVDMSGTGKFENECARQVPEGERDVALEDILRARSEGAFVSPCGTEGCRWEDFPEWPEEFPYDAFDEGRLKTGEEDET